jgi:hypothetical protein
LTFADVSEAQWPGLSSKLSLVGRRDHLIREFDHGADTEAHLLGDLDDADSFGELGPCLAQLVRIGARTAEALFDLAMLRDEVAIALDLILGALQPGSEQRRLGA